MTGQSEKSFARVLEDIKAGPVDYSALRPFLTLESKDERYQVNFALAGAFYNRFKRDFDQRSLRYARACIDRALLLSRYSLEVLPLLIQINQAAGDVVAIKEALKRVGIEQAASGNFDAALKLFNRWVYADSEFTGKDLHSFDPDILTCVDRMAAFLRPEMSRKPEPTTGRRIRLAYLMDGLVEVGSVLVKIDRVFAKLHDKARFEIAYFTFDRESDVAGSPDAQSAVRDLRADGCQVFIPADGRTTYERVLSVSQNINEFQPDVLITAGGLANLNSFFVTRLKPATVTIALNQGGSALFSWHTFDHSISWFQTNVPDCPANCSHVRLELVLPETGVIQPTSRAELGVPADATLITAGGRWQKFQDPGYWRALGELLDEHTDLYLLMIGFGEEKMPFLGDVLTARARAKIRFQSWRRDYLELLAAADLLVDSYPVGGGVFSMDAMSLGVPVLSFEHDYVNTFSNNDCSGGNETLGLPELLIRRGDFEELKRRVLELARNPDRRRQLGKLCAEQIHQNFGDPLRMVRRCEEIYESVLRKQLEAPGVARSGAPGLMDSENNSLDAYKLLLMERENALNRREADLNLSEADLNLREERHNSRVLVQLIGRLRRRWH